MDEFHRALLEAVDEALLALGEPVRNVIYCYMENRFSIKRDEIPDRPSDFAEALKNMLGVGANVLLKLIVKRLYAKFGLNFEEKPGWGFKEYLNEAEKNVRVV
ncbi:MAG: hypothetical protein QXL69_00350 [Candidatus Bathyarchaeia archaeon]|nr:hypothetical protein [Candidatus Bathyarchaeota archaeon]